MIVTEREREAETQAEGEAGSMHREPDVGLDPGSPGSRPGPKAGAKPLCHPGIPVQKNSKEFIELFAQGGRAQLPTYMGAELRDYSAIQYEGEKN